jgi:hypothetical protein
MLPLTIPYCTIVQGRLIFRRKESQAMLGRSAKAVFYAIGLALVSLGAWLCWNEVTTGGSAFFAFSAMAICFFVALWCTACLLSLFLDHDQEYTGEEGIASKEAEGMAEEHGDADHVVTKNWEGWWRW